MNEHLETSPAPRLLDRVRDAIRFRHYSYRTEQSYVAWIRRFILFHGKRHPQAMGAVEIREFLTHLAVHRNITPSTQNQVLSALLLLYRHVLNTGIYTPVLNRGGRAVRSPLDVREERARYAA